MTLVPMSDAERARSFAVSFHSDQKYGDLPYVVHLDDVFALSKGVAPLESPLLPAAYLHDVVEDTACTLAEVERNFGEDVAQLVWAVTGVGENRKARNASIYEKLVSCPLAKNLKVADRIANLAPRDVGMRDKKRAMYLTERREFESAVAGADPRLLLTLSQAYSTGYTWQT